MGNSAIRTEKLTTGRDFFIMKGFRPSYYAGNQLQQDVVEYLKQEARVAIQQKKQLEQTNKELEKYACTVAHDLKAPCNSLMALSSLISDSYAEKLGEEGAALLSMMTEACASMSSLIEGILNNTKGLCNEQVSLHELMHEVYSLSGIPENFSFGFSTEQAVIYTSKTALLQILLNLCVNAVKYNDKAKGEIRIHMSDTDTHYRFCISDNGPGIPEAEYDRIFDLYATIGTDRYNQRGNGIGLSTVKDLVNKLGGKITISSEKNEGCTFTFTIAKNNP